jgi:hypothetical protein
MVCLLTAALLASGLPFRCEAKSYSSGGGHSYSSHSSSSGGGHSFSSGSGHSFSSGGSHSSSSVGSHSSSSGSSHGSSGASTRTGSSGSGSGSRGSGSASSSPSKNFSSGSGKSYSSGSTWSDNGRHSYTSSKSYSSGSGRTFTSKSGSADVAPAAPSPRKAEPASSSSGFTFDQAAAHARKEEASKSKFTQFKESQLSPPAVPIDARASAAGSPSYRVTAPPLPTSSGGSYRPTTYVPDAGTLSSRPLRIYNVFNPYQSRPVVIYHDPYNSLFWWWLLDRSLDDRAYWAYHHRYDMDPARYQALVAQDQQLEARVQQLETQQAPRDPNYTPPGVDRDLMYSDRYVQQAYSNRPTTSGVVAFWVLAIPMALAVSAFFIWLIWFKRWQTAPRIAA